jgi:hypothetical protein
MFDFKKLTGDELIDLLQDAAKNWLAHDGLWFRCVEEEFGLATAMRLDAKVWSQFAEAEAKRIMKRHKIAAGSGIEGLIKALQFRMYALINEQEISQTSQSSLTFKMKTCRVQEARKRKNLPDFPCREVGLVEFGTFTKTIDERFEIRCISCPPQVVLEDCWCAWEFSLP